MAEAARPAHPRSRLERGVHAAWVWKIDKGGSDPERGVVPRRGGLKLDRRSPFFSRSRLSLAFTPLQGGAWDEHGHFKEPVHDKGEGLHPVRVMKPQENVALRGAGRSAEVIVATQERADEITIIAFNPSMALLFSAPILWCLASRMNRNAIPAAFLSLLFPAMLASHAAALDPIPLWPQGAPGALGKEDKDIPSLTPYPAAESATGAAMVICPGGGYGGLAQHEGRDYALWLNQQGVACFVLKYRLGSGGYRHPRMIEDAARALRWVRTHAATWKVDPNRIGIMGSSAGGHLASTLVTHFDHGQAGAADPVDRASSRPDLGVLCYPVITMGAHTHQGSKHNLLGKEPSPELVELLSNEKQVRSNTPPCFVWHTWEDKAVKVENSLEFAAALQKAGVPFDLHVYQKGRHGIGLADKEPFSNVHPWAKDLLFWLKEQGFLTAHR